MTQNDMQYLIAHNEQELLHTYAHEEIGEENSHIYTPQREEDLPVWLIGANRHAHT